MALSKALIKKRNLEIIDTKTSEPEPQADKRCDKNPICGFKKVGIQAAKFTGDVSSIDSKDL